MPVPPPNAPGPRGTPPAPRPSGTAILPGGYVPGRYRARLLFALAASLWLHAFILSLHFGFEEFGLPGFQLPWVDRPLQRPPLTVRLAPALPPPPLPRAETEFVAQLAAPRKTALPPVAELAAETPRTRPPPKPPHPALITQAEPLQKTFSVPPPSAGEPEQKAAPAAEMPPATVQPTATEVVAKVAVEEPPPMREPEQPAPKPIDEDAARRARELEEAGKQEQAVAERLALDLEARLKADEAARQQAAALARQREIEARRIEEARRVEEARRKDEAKRLEEARRIDEAKKQDEAGAQRLALALEAKRRADEAARRQAEDAALQQAARLKELEARRQEEARKLEQAKQQEEARKVEEVRTREEARKLEEARRLAELRRIEEAKRQEDAMAQRLAQELAAKGLAEETARAQADVLARQQQLMERLRSAGGGAAMPGQLSGSELASKTLDQLRRPEAPRAVLPGARSSPRGDDAPRRRSILGSTEADVSLRMYAESWRVKVERHGNLNLPTPAHMGVRYNPLVTVTIRSDGSVEEVFIHRSSGWRAIDEAVLRIVRLLAPYSAFPPEMARQFDAVAIRRVWSFGDTLEIREEVR